MTREDYIACVQEYSDMVFKIAFSYFGAKADAEDVMQDVFLKVLRADPIPDAGQERKAWLIRMTINRCHSLFRSPFRRRSEWLSDYAWESLAAPQTLEDTVTTRQSVYQAVMSLPAKYRLPVHLYYYEDMTIKEVAEAIGLKETTVQTRLARARKMLEGRLKDVTGY